MLRFPLKAKPRKMNSKLIGPGSGPSERIKYLQILVTRLFRHERIEGREDRMDEARGYAEQLLNLAIQNGDRHKATMEMADKWLLEKDLVHKLFKVLAPRYSNYSEAFTQTYKLPAVYPGKKMFQAVLELKGHPYPPVIPKQHSKDNYIVNVLLRSAKQTYSSKPIDTETGESEPSDIAGVDMTLASDANASENNKNVSSENNKNVASENNKNVADTDSIDKSKDHVSTV